MEVDVDKTLSSPILVAQSISKLVTKIKKDAQNSTNEIKYLKEKCISANDANISLAAGKGLVMLVECDILQTGLTISELVSSLSFARCFNGITTAICDLLLIDLKRKVKDVESHEWPYNLRAPQHPLISIFIRSPDTCFDIMTNIKYFYIKDYNDVPLSANQLLFPFYMYILCNPTADVPDQFYYELWNFIIRIKKHQSLNVIIYAIAWLQISTKKQVLRASKVLMASINFYSKNGDDEMVDVLVLWLVSLISEFVKLELDPEEVITYLYYVINTLTNLKTIASCMLYMLADCVPICPSNYLDDLLKLCYVILESGFTNKFTRQVLKASALQWMAYGCLLTSYSLNLTNQILLHIENDANSNNHTRNLYQNKTFLHLKSTNQRIHIAVELNLLSEQLQPSQILRWLNRIEVIPAHMSKIYFKYFTMLLLDNKPNPDVTLKVTSILLQISSQYKETTTQLLTLFLYKLSNTTNSKIHLALLKALPKMAVLQENLPLVLNTLNTISKGMLGFKSFAMMLFYHLWNINEKCYMYLQNVLVEPIDKTLHGRALRELYITKASVIKEVCLKRPEVHGRELVGHVSDILNKCNDDNGGVATALAIDAISALSKNGIVDINSAWNELSPKFVHESRPVVLKSLCTFMAEVSYFESSECNEIVTDDILKTLWKYATTSQNLEVICATYKALGCFTLEQLSVQFPDTLRIPSNPSSNFLGSMLLPGRCWINLLLDVQKFALDSVGDLLIKLTSAEISAYRGGTYNVAEGQREPQNLNYLPEYSIVRALENYIRSQVGNWSNESSKLVYLQCLRILNQEYSKPLPPADWCFLQELVHIPESRSYCISLASHQVQLSGTARRLVENIIAAVCNDNLEIEDVQTVYKNLKYLCNSIQPMTLRPFIEYSVKFAVTKAKNENDTQILEFIIIQLQTTLSNEKLHEANRLMLSQVIVKTVQELDINSDLFTKFLECVSVLPIRHIDELSSPRLWKQHSEKQISMSIQIRCALALQATVSPLTWLNDILDVEHLLPSQLKFFFINLIRVMEKQRNSDFATSWIIELLGSIQSTIANKFMTQEHLKFLCDVFILSVIILSCQHLFVIEDDELTTNVPLRLRLLPQSIVQLIKLSNWKSYTLQCPSSSEELKKYADEFALKWNFPHCFGAIDGKHITMVAPQKCGSLYYNYKNTHSIVLMGVADANYKLIYVDVGCNGRISDGGVFSNCSLHEALESKRFPLPEPEALPQRDLPVPYVMVADDAFAMTSYILKPYGYRNQPAPNRIFNYRLSRARRIIENVFGIMSSKFRVLRKPINLAPNKVKDATLAICALHNFLICTSNNYLCFDSIDFENPTTHEIANGEWRNEPQPEGTLFPLERGRQRNYSISQKTVRDEFREYFMTTAGEVPWQYQFIS